VVLQPPRNVDPIVPWPDVLGLFGLSSPLRAPLVVTGGWSHSVWRVDTPQGTYAIKEMVDNPADWWIEQLNGAIAFELAAWRAGTIVMAEPMPLAGSDHYLGQLSLGGGPRRYRCHRWVEGEPCLGLSPAVERSEQVGLIVSALAQLNVEGGNTAHHLAWNALDAYDETVAEATSRRQDWAPALAELRPNVAQLRDDFIHLAGRAEPMVILHRDIDPKNTAVHADNAITLLDWDYAGPRLIAAELLGAALSFAGGALAADEECLLATIATYRESGGPPASFNDASAPLAEESFRWIMLNAWRCLGHLGSPQKRRLSPDRW
jgi:hypothetical protein